MTRNITCIASVLLINTHDWQTKNTTEAGRRGWCL